MASGIRIILDALVAAADQYLADRILPEIAQEIVATQSAGSLLRERLRRCCRRLEKPLILLLDEVDSLVGDTLISLLRQIRAGYPDRPSAFPQTVLLCGVRDVRDYRIHNGDKQVITSGSAFNIKSKSLRLGNFSHGDLVGLYAQHTEETGQAFEDGLIKYVFKQTNSQPWLVNALGYEACFRAKENRDCTQPITLGAMAAARERLIERRDTRLDQLVDKLREPRVHRIISELLSGAIEPGAMPPSEDDQLYVQDLGLICTRPQVEIANPVYRGDHPPRPHLDCPDPDPPGDCLVCGLGRTPGFLQAVERLPTVLPGEQRDLDRTVRLQGSRSPIIDAGVPAAHRQEQWTDRLGVRVGPSHRSVSAVAAG